MTTPAIDVRSLRFAAAGRTILDEITFHVGAGEIVGLLGPNGAGKTTTIESIEGYRVPTSGDVTVLGLNPLTDRTALADRWGVMPQEGGLPMGLTVIEAIELFVGLHQSSTSPDSLIDLCGLDSVRTRRWRGMSGGEQQRLNLALALSGGSDVLLLDEPTAALDAQGRERVLDVIRARADAGTAVLITTHNYADVERVADRAVVLDHGRVVVSGSVAELTGGQPHIRFAAAAALDAKDLSALLDADVTEQSAGHYQVDAEPTPARMAAITSWLAEQGEVASTMEAGRRSLEELMLGLESGARAPHTDKHGDELTDGTSS